MSTNKNRAKTERTSIHVLCKKLASLLSSSSSNSTTTTAAATPMLSLVGRHLRRLLRRLWPCRKRRQPKTKITVINNPKRPSAPRPNPHADPAQARPIRIATFNAAMFSMAPAVGAKAPSERPTKGILKHSSFSASKRRVSINLPEDEISVERSKGKGVAAAAGRSSSFGGCSWRFSERSVLDVLREAGADVVALQNVKAEEEKGMRPLSELAEGLGMRYVFAESWAPEYGNAILSRWEIKGWKAQKICDDSDFRNVLKATIDIPRTGEVNIHCTHLDHLDENWRMKQIRSILRSSDDPHILLGGLNSLDETDYSAERWNDIVKYYEEIGKPTPKVEVMKFLKGKQYSDAKNFAGECESVVMVAKGQDVQGTCKYGTRVDYILASPNSPYKFVPGSYGVVSSKGTSDHHIVKIDIVIDKTIENTNRKPKKRVVKIDKDSSKGIWGTYS